MQQQSNAKCSAITRPTGVFWLRVWSQVRDGPPAGELTAHCCSLPHASHPLHTHCTAGRFGLACRGWCCRITLHSASVVRLNARPRLACFLCLFCPCPCLSPGSGKLLSCLAGWACQLNSSLLDRPPAPSILPAKQTKQTKL